MGLFDAIGSFASNLAQSVVNGVSGAIEAVGDWCSNLVADVGAALSSSANGDVVGINVKGIPAIIDAIEDYISRVNKKLDKLKENSNTSTAKAMKGDYAAATKLYIQTSADVCYRIITQLRYFEDKLIAVKEAYEQKDENMTSQINTSTTEMNNQWTEYQRQK